MDIALYVIFGLVFLGSATMLGLSLNDYVRKEDDVTTLFKGKHRLIVASIVAGGLSLMLLAVPLTFNKTHALGMFMTLFGAFGFALALFTFISAFVIHYFKFNVLNVHTRQSKLVTVFSGVLSLIFFFVMLDGLTYIDALTFPLPKGIPFAEPLVAFYAIFILSGAILVLFVSDHEFYKKYGRHGVLENVFYVAFPAGILGARLWYVIGEWENGGYGDDLLSIFAFRDGGLAIMGGALLGIIVGVWFFIRYRKEYQITFAVDVIVPTILIAQAIGRWGNFTNQEVYGMPIVNMNNWFWLPEFVKRQMFIGGEYRQPFFLIESILNITGYFLIRYGVGAGLKKYRKPLDLGFLYIVWYGIVRFIMEPLRDPLFNMGQGGKWSVYNALIFFIVGIILIVLNHVFKFYKYIDEWQAKRMGPKPSVTLEQTDE